MNLEPLLGPITLLIVAAINAATYFLTRRAGKQDTKEAKDDVQESTKSYVDQYIKQLETRIEGCTDAIATLRTENTQYLGRVETAEGLAKTANDQVSLLTPRMTDLENQIVDLQGQIAAKKQEITRVEGERDTAMAELNTLQKLPEQQEQGRKAIADFVDLLIVAVEKRFPLPTAPGSPAIVDAAVADADVGVESEAGSQAA